MDLSLINSETVEQLSKITGVKLSQRRITQPVLFLANLAIVLLGVMFADTQVTGEEKQRLQQTLNKFIPDGDVRELTKLLVRGVQANKDYTQPRQLMKLSAPLSQSERLLLIGLGYEMSAADGTMDVTEKRYLESIAAHLQVPSKHLAVLEAHLCGEEVSDRSTLEEVKYLLDPARFQSLETVFVKAASDLLLTLFPKSSEVTEAKPKKSIQAKQQPYQKLLEFQRYRHRINKICNQLSQVVEECSQRDLLPATFAVDTVSIKNRLQSEGFRVAVAGEFSQGKSTLLNALLGEEIQPVRAIPCNGTVTVLKYGNKKRVICRYTDGREEEISSDDYHRKASISEQAALGSLSDELARSDLDEIIFEHPDLELCRGGVELVDSPGLNEHPDRTAIAQKILKNTDAAIFLTNASRPLTQGERDLIRELKTQLNGGKVDEPADNLFVLANFMDLLRREKDRQDVRSRIENFVSGQPPVIAGENRLHFVSAQAALDAILEGYEDEYLKTFQSFVDTVENFLVSERGTVKIRRSVSELQGIIQKSLESLNQCEKALEGKIQVSESAKQEIVHQIQDIRERDEKMNNLAVELAETATQEVLISYQVWVEGLYSRIEKSSEQWDSLSTSKKQIFRDYANCFQRDLSGEFDSWINLQIKPQVLMPRLQQLEAEIDRQIGEVKRRIERVDFQVGSNIGNQFNVSLKVAGWDRNLATSVSVEDDANLDSWIGGLKAGGTLVGVVGNAVAAVTGLIFGDDEDATRNKIKQEVIDLGFEEFDKSVGRIFEIVCEYIELALHEKVEAASQVLEDAVSISENLLEQQQRTYRETVDQRNSDKLYLRQKRQGFEQILAELEAILKITHAN